MSPRLDAAIARSNAVAEVALAPLADAGRLFVRRFEPSRACLLADEAAWAAAGPPVQAALDAAGIATRIHVLPASPRPKPSVERADSLAAILAEDDAIPVAIGSGVMNDLVKHAAFGLDRPYLCVATAASMDGYTSAGAPLSRAGFKMTIPCRPARAILADAAVIAAAPDAMAGWGYGDLAGKIPAGADWILADALGVEPIDAGPWSMVQDDLRAQLSRPEGVAKGDPDALAALFEGLALVGLAMESHGSSRPASGADHQVAHLWEMEGLEQDGEPVSHGACVAVGCVTILALYDWLLAQDLTELDTDAILARAPDLDAKAGAIREAFGAGAVAERALAEVTAKHAGPTAHAERLTTLRRVWPDLRARLGRHLIPAAEMREMLQKAGAPELSEAIGVDRDRLRRTARHARFLRSRYTLLDLLDEAGLLDRALDATLPASAPA